MSERNIIDTFANKCYYVIVKDKYSKSTTQLL